MIHNFPYDQTIVKWQGKTKRITMPMNNCKQVHGSSLGFLGDLIAAKKSQITNKDVANF